MIHEGKMLRKWLDSRGLSQKEILNKLKLKSRSSLYSYYETERFSADVVKKLSKIGYNVHVNTYSAIQSKSEVKDHEETYQLKHFGDRPRYIEDRIHLLERKVDELLAQHSAGDRLSKLLSKKDSVEINKRGNEE